MYTEHVSVEEVVGCGRLKWSVMWSVQIRVIGVQEITG